MSSGGPIIQLPARLPPELLLIIKEYIPQSDLRTHVCFYSTCRTTASLYGDSGEQAAFWRRSCALAGIGWLRSDSSWKEIAFETIARDGFCSHPQCGGALLEWNGTTRFTHSRKDHLLIIEAAIQVERAMRLYDWDPEEGAWDASLDEYDAVEWTTPDRPTPVCSRIFQWMQFSASPSSFAFNLPTEVRLRSHETLLPRHRLDIIAHPIATRSFATFPTVRRMRFHYHGLTYGTKANNVPGVTVWDVLRSIKTE